MTTPFIVGFTGTRNGLTADQDAALRAQFLALRDERQRPLELHHGDCVGADAQAHAVFRELFPGSHVVVYPPVDDRLRARCAGENVTVLPARSNFARNRAIVAGCDILIGCPREMTRQPFGGTWYTLGYAKTMFRKVRILYPDGSVADGC